MAEIRVEMNESFWSQIGFQPGVEAVMGAVAGVAAAEAKSTAPVDTGAYRDSIHVETTRSPRRIIKRVVASDRKARWIEARTSNLRKAAAKAKRSVN